MQRQQLVNEITFNALTLVQDPYGNYVVQYILDLNDKRFSDGVIRQFAGNVCALSVQKFSSNVIEKVTQKHSIIVPVNIFFSVSALPNIAQGRCSLKNCWIALVLRSCCETLTGIIVSRCVIRHLSDPIASSSDQFYRLLSTMLTRPNVLCSWKAFAQFFL